jgi:small subunit ribosomal protein S6
MPTLVPTSEDTRIYEWCILYPYPFGQKEEAELLRDIEAMFTEVGSKLVKKDKWGRRGLAYSVGGFNEGSYVVYYYEMDPSKVKEIDTQLRIMKGVLRHMNVKPPKDYQVIEYSDAYEQWLKDREQIEEKRAREKEEKVKDLVARKAKRQAKMVADEKKKDDAPAKAISKEDITQKLDKLISDDQVDL